MASNYPEGMDSFISKLNFNQDGNHVIDEVANIALPAKEWELQHDNIMTNNGITIWTGANSSGTQITDFTVQVGSKDWKNKVVFGASVSVGQYYISYYSQGDKNDADDLNGLFNAVQSMQQAMGLLQDLNTTAKSTIVQAINEVLSKVGSGGVLDTTPPNEVTNIISSTTTSTVTLNWTASTSPDISQYKIYNNGVLLGTTSSNTFTVVGLSPGVSYTFIVRSADIYGNTSVGINTTVTTAQIIDTISPNDVTNLVILSKTTSSVTLTWTASASSDINSYRVYNGSTLLTTASTTSSTLSGLLPNTNYTFTVKGVDSSGNISTGVSISVSTSQSGDTTPPNDVLGFKTTNVSSNSVSLSWNASTSTDTQDYQLYQGTTLLSTIIGTTYSVVGLNPFTSYAFTIKSRDTAGNISNGVTLNVTTSVLDTIAPNNVTNLNASNITETTLLLAWVASTSSDIASYDVYNGGTLLANVSSTSYSITGLMAKTSYNFTIKSKDNSGNTSTGISINVMTADTTPPVNITSLVATGTTTNSVSLSWGGSTSTDVQDYQVYNNGVLVSTVTATTYTVTGLSSSTTFTFTVKARDNAGNISSGVSISATTATSADTTAPDNVTNLSYSNLTDRSVFLTWTASISPDILSYDIYNGSTFIVNTSNTEYTLTGLLSSTIYTITVKSKDNSNNVSAGTSVTFTTLSSAVVNIDGGTFTDTSTSTVDGGTFTDTTTGSTIDGGVF